MQLSQPTSPANPGLNLADRHAEMLQAARALVADEPDAIANMANLAALLWQYMPALNWAGFYRMVGGGLVLGPFIGKPACVRIALDRGVCGAAASSGQTQCVPDVHAFPGHIACDAQSRSELVVPVFTADGRVGAVLDLDSPDLARFTADDVTAIERLIYAIASSIA